MMGAKTLEAQIADGTAKVEGDAGILKQLASTMVDFDPRFEIMPGTKAKETEVTGYVESGIHGKPDPYEAFRARPLQNSHSSTTTASSYCKLGHVRRLTWRTSWINRRSCRHPTRSGRPAHLLPSARRYQSLPKHCC